MKHNLVLLQSDGNENMYDFLPCGGAVGAKAEITASVPAGVPPPKVCPCGDLTGSGRDLAWFSGA